MNEPKVERRIWETERFSILSVTLTREFVAVYCEDDKKQEPMLWPQTLDAIGVAEVSTQRYRESDPPGNPTAFGMPEITREVIGLYLDNAGEWDIPRKARNYAGMARSGECIDNVTGYLQPDLLQSLERSRKEKKLNEQAKSPPEA